MDLGHRDVAFITPPLTRRQWQRSRRIDGFVKDINGISAGAVETLQAAQVVASARKALASANAAHGLLDTLRAKAFLNAKEAFDLLN